MRKSMMWMIVLSAVMALAACARLKEPATNAVSGAESTLAAVRDEAARYAPEELRQAEGSIASMKDSLVKRDYKAVMAAAPIVTSQLTALKDTVAKKSAEALAAAKQQWGTLDTEVPKMVEAIQKQVSQLQSRRRLPAGVSKESLQAAVDGLASIKDSWSQATAFFGAGHVEQAVAQAQKARDKGTEVLHSLGMSAP